jgi:DNA-binding transcriptional MerR regulator
VSARSYLSIGDVLTLLRQEFPDITISKIRFLESQGLVNPERTPSGYRKFYEHDVERLRWVLRQQREHFLPLKVIKDRLDDGSEGSEEANGSGGSNGNEVDAPVEEASAPTPAAGVSSAAIDARVHAADRGPTRTDRAEPDPGDGDTSPVTTGAGQPAGTESPDPARLEHADPVLVGQAAARRAPSQPGAPGRAGQSGRSGQATSERPTSGGGGPGLPGIEGSPERGSSSSARSALAGGGSSEGQGQASAAARPRRSRGSSAETPDPAPPTAAQPEPASDSPSDEPSESPSGSGGGASSSPTRTGAPTGGRQADLTGASLTMAELAAASGLDEEVLEQLREYGLLVATQVGGAEYFDEDCLAIANLAAGFARYGVEPRHLRLYKNTADREAGFIEQIVLPLVRQRNPEARQRAGRTADELIQLGQGLRSTLLRGAIRDLLGG